MNVVIKFTTLGADTGPLFDLFSDATVPPFCCAFASNVTKTQLLAGYSTDAVPAGTNYIRVVSKGVCTTSVDLLVPATITTTSTTSTTSTTTTSTTLPFTTTSTTAAPTTTSTTTVPPTTTTTTTQLFTFLFNPTASFPASNACPFTTYTLTLYANKAVLDATNKFYTQSNLTNPIVGGGNYFKHNSGTAYAFNNTGQIQGTYVCPTTTTTSTTTGTAYSYNIQHAPCGTCGAVTAAVINNRTALTVNQWYYIQSLGRSGRIVSFIGTVTVGSYENSINDASKQATCAGVQCP